METYSVSERLPDAGQVVNVRAGTQVECLAEFDGVDFVGPRGPFLPGAVTAWWPVTGDGNGKAIAAAYAELVEREQKLRALERKIAYDAARECIEIDGIELEDLPHDDGFSALYDISFDQGDYMAERVAYLEAIGKLQRSECEPSIVRVLDL